MLLKHYLPIVCTALAFGHCAGAPAGLESIEARFLKPEFLSNGDGWAEARRRSAIKTYLRTARIPFEEMQYLKADKPGDKYRRTMIALTNGEGQKPALGKVLRITLALTPTNTSDWRAVGPSRQQACDRTLFAALSRLPELIRRYRKITLTMDEVCYEESLTARLTAID